MLFPAVYEQKQRQNWIAVNGAEPRQSYWIENEIGRVTSIPY